MTKNYNFLQNNAFEFTIARIPETTFRVTSTQVPAISVPQPDVDVPGITQYFPGTYTQFEEMTVQFNVDENLLNYEEMYHWVTQQRFAVGNDYKANSQHEVLIVSDGTLITMNNQSNPNRVFKFLDMFPIALGPLSFDSTVDSPEPVTCTATFKYSYFVLQKKLS
jgi:hypothetical protein